MFQQINNQYGNKALILQISYLFVDVDDDSIEEENEVVFVGFDMTLPPPAMAVATAMAE